MFNWIWIDLRLYYWWRIIQYGWDEFEKIIKLKNDINGLVESDESDFKADEWVKQCYDALNDDFNSPRLIAKLFDLYKIVQDIKIRNKHIKNMFSAVNIFSN